MSVLVNGENGIRRVFCRLRFNAEYWEKRWKRWASVGSDCLRFVITIPMSSANALSVVSSGRFCSSLVSSMSMHKTNSVGESGHPCLTPDFSSKDWYSPLSNTNWCVFFMYNDLIACKKWGGTPMWSSIAHK